MRIAIEIYEIIFLADGLVLLGQTLFTVHASPQMNNPSTHEHPFTLNPLPSWLSINCAAENSHYFVLNRSFLPPLMTNFRPFLGTTKK